MEYHVLQRDFHWDGQTITLQLGNPVEEPLLHSMKPELIQYVKDTLGASVLVASEILAAETKKRIYTNKEKFEHLAAKYPALQEMKDRFGLDVDF